MFVILLIALPVAEVLALVEVAGAIGWPLALALLLASSLLGVQLLRIVGRAALQRVSLAVSERRAPGLAAIDGALAFLAALLLAVPGFVTGAIGALLLAPPVRALAARRISRRYAGRLMSFLAQTERFAPSGRARPHADVDSTAVEDDLDQLAR